MKNFLYFIVGIIYLPIVMVIKIIIYVRDLGMWFIDIIIYVRDLGEGFIKIIIYFWKRFNNNLKKSES